MKVQFDQNVPRNLRKHLSNHEVFSAAKMGCNELENGLLLHAAEAAGFDVFVTGDQNLRYQQNFATRKIAIVELTKNNWPSVEPHVEQIAVVMGKAQPGAYATVQCPFVFRPRRRE